MLFKLWSAKTRQQAFFVIRFLLSVAQRLQKKVASCPARMARNPAPFCSQSSCLEFNLLILEIKVGSDERSKSITSSYFHFVAIMMQSWSVQRIPSHTWVVFCNKLSPCSHPVIWSLKLLHCYMYLFDPLWRRLLKEEQMRWSDICNVYSRPRRAVFASLQVNRFLLLTIIIITITVVYPQDSGI